MRKYIFKILFASVIVFGVTSCKNNEEVKNETLVLDEIENKEEARDFIVVPQSSTIHWLGSKPTGEHEGFISISEGKFSLKDGKIAEGKFDIDMKSIVVTDLEGEDKDKLEAHLMGTTEGAEDHFFHVTEFPAATFKATGTVTENEKTLLVGDLTLKGKTNQVSFPVEVNMVDNDVAEIKSAPFKIDRSKWDIKFKSKSFFDDLGGNFISDEIQLEINLMAKGL